MPTRIPPIAEVREEHELILNLSYSEDITKSLLTTNLLVLVNAQRLCDTNDLSYYRSKVPHRVRDLYGHSMDDVFAEIDKDGENASTLVRLAHTLISGKNMSHLGLTSKRKNIPKNGKTRPIAITSTDKYLLSIALAQALDQLARKKKALSKGVIAFRSKYDLKLDEINRSRKGLAKYKPQDLYAAKIYKQSENYPFAISLDLSNAFDETPHPVIAKPLKEKLGLNDDDIRLILQCAKINSIEIVHQDNKARKIWHKSKDNKGIEQGNVLSSLLFNLAMDHVMHLALKPNSLKLDNAVNEVEQLFTNPSNVDEAEFSSNRFKQDHDCYIFMYGDDIVVLFKTMDEALKGWSAIQDTFKQEGFNNLRPRGYEGKKTRLVDLREDSISVLKTYKITRKDKQHAISLTEDKYKELAKTISIWMKRDTKAVVHHARIKGDAPLLSRGSARKLEERAKQMRKKIHPQHDNHPHRLELTNGENQTNGDHNTMSLCDECNVEPKDKSHETILNDSPEDNPLGEVHQNSSRNTPTENRVMNKDNMDNSIPMNPNISVAPKKDRTQISDNKDSHLKDTQTDSHYGTKDESNYDKDHSRIPNGDDNPPNREEANISIPNGDGISYRKDNLSEIPCDEDKSHKGYKDHNKCYNTSKAYKDNHPQGMIKAQEATDGGRSKKGLYTNPNLSSKKDHQCNWKAKPNSVKHSVAQWRDGESPYAHLFLSSHSYKNGKVIKTPKEEDTSNEEEGKGDQFKDNGIKIIVPKESEWKKLLEIKDLKLNQSLRSIAGYRVERKRNSPSNCNEFIIDLRHTDSEESHPNYKILINAILKASSVRGKVNVLLDPRSSIRGDLEVIGDEPQSMYKVVKEIYIDDLKSTLTTLSKNNLVSRNKRKSKKAQKRSSRSKAIKLGATLILTKAISVVSTSSDSSEFLGRTFVCFDRKERPHDRYRNEVIEYPRGIYLTNSSFAVLDALTSYLKEQQSSEVIALPVDGIWSTYITYLRGRTGVQHKFVTQIKRWTWTKQKGWWMGRPR
jgi:hypothetical protein